MIEIFIWRLTQQILAIVPRTVNTVYAQNSSVDIARYVYVIGRFPVVFGINSTSSEVFEGSKIARGVAECYFPSKTALRELFIPNTTGNRPITY